MNAFFESVWALYPIKRGKGQVSKSKREALYQIGLEELTRAIDRYIMELAKGCILAEAAEREHVF